MFSKSLSKGMEESNPGSLPSLETGLYRVIQISTLLSLFTDSFHVTERSLYVCVGGGSG